MENYESLVHLAKKAGIKPRALQEARRGFPLNEEYCKLLCKEINIPFDELCKHKPRKTMYGNQDDYLEEADKMIVGLKNRILSKGHIKGLEEMLNDLVLEASYLGVNAQKDGNAEFIETAVRKRRGYA